MSFIFLRNRVTGGAAFSPASLFASGEQGVWYEPSPSTCFTDTGGTTPATYGQAVAYLQDKSGNGNHATQTTLASRPILARVPPRGRVNELSETDTLATQSVTVTAAQRTLSFTGTGTVTLTGASTAGPLVGTGAGDRVSLTFTPSAGSLTLTVLGTVTDAQLELGASATTYQSVADSLGYDITEAGVTSLEYLAFDGSDDFMTTSATISTGNKSLAIGVEHEAATSVAFGQTSTDRTYIGFLTVGKNNYGFAEGGANQTGAAMSQNTPYVILATDTAKSLVGRLNGVQDVSTTYNGTAGGATLEVGRAGGTGSAFFNGKLFNALYVDRVLTAQEISDTESYVANLSGVSL